MYPEGEIKSGSVLWAAGATVGDMSADLESQWIDCQGFDSMSITLYAASDTHVGTISIELTDDPSKARSNEETIAPIPSPASGSAFNHRIALYLNGARFARIKYNHTSGAGTLSGWWNMR